MTYGGFETTASKRPRSSSGTAAKSRSISVDAVGNAVPVHVARRATRSASEEASTAADVARTAARPPARPRCSRSPFRDRQRAQTSGVRRRGPLRPEPFGLGTRDQHVGTHFELEPSELGDARQRVAAGPFARERREARPGGAPRRRPAASGLVRDHAAAVGAQDQSRGRAASRRGSGTCATRSRRCASSRRSDDGATRRFGHALISSRSRCAWSSAFNASRMSSMAPFMRLGRSCTVRPMR